MQHVAKEFVVVPAMADLQASVKADWLTWTGRVSLIFFTAFTTAGFVSGSLNLIGDSMLQKLAPESFEQVKSLISGLGAILTLTSPLFGALADRRRPARKAVFITSLLIAVLGLVVMAFGGNDLYIYCTGFLIQNLGFAGFTTVFVALITVFKDVDSMSIRKSTFLAFYIMGLAVGAIIGLMISPNFNANQPRAQGGNFFGLIVMCLAIIAAVLVVFLLCPLTMIYPQSDAYLAVGSSSDAADAAADAAGGSSLSAFRAIRRGAYLRVCDDSYKTWRLVTLARFIYYLGEEIWTTNAYFFISIVLRHLGNPLKVSATEGQAEAIVAGLAALPIGYVVHRVGAPVCLISSICCATLEAIIYGFADAMPVLVVLAIVKGARRVAYQVSDLVMISNALPDPNSRSLDIGVWAMMDSIGTAIGAAISAPIMNALGGSSTRLAALSLEGALSATRAPFRNLFIISACVVLTSLVPASLAWRQLRRADPSKARLTVVDGRDSVLEPPEIELTQKATPPLASVRA